MRALETYTSTDYNDREMAVMQLKMKALVLDAIHFRDVVDELEASKATSTQDWAWMKQLRYYATQQGQSCVVRMADAEVDYTFEYQGNAPKLVYTPLTDKCFLTLTQAIRLGTCPLFSAQTHFPLPPLLFAAPPCPTGPLRVLSAHSHRPCRVRRQPVRPRRHGQDRVRKGAGSVPSPPGAGLQL